MKKGKENNNPTNTKDKVDPNKKQGVINKNPRDLLPPNSQHIKNIRETFPIKQIEISAEENKEIKEILLFSKPFEVLPEWPTEEELKVFSSSQESETELYTDPFNKRIIFPKKFEENFEKEVTWLRPQEYIKNNLLNKEIKISFPNKNLFKMRNEIKEFYILHELPNRQARKGSSDNYNQNNNIDNGEENYYIYDKNNNYLFNTEAIEKSNLGDKNQNDIIEMLHKKRNSFKDCFKIIEKRLDIRIVNWSEREENDEEFKKRREEEMQEKLRQMEKEKESKNKKKAVNNQAAQNKPGQQVKDAVGGKAELENLNILNSEERLKVKEIKPSNLYLLNDPKYNSYVKWVLSILQMIKDLNLCDAQSGKSIIYNIYPQKDGFPVVSTSGKYWIKLYLMGKARLVEIDDLIPCNKNEDFIFPRCDRLDEIWPALLTKAILKLHSYKRLSKYSEETGDLSVIYSLTGFIAEKISINSIRVSNIEKYLQSNDNYLQKHKILACLAWKEEEEITSINKLSPTNKNERSKFKKIDSVKNNTASGNLNKFSSKTSILSLNTNLSQIPEEMQKIEKENPAYLNSKVYASMGKKRKLSNSRTNSYIGNPNQIKAFSERNVIGTPTNENYINFLKNIPEENNFDLDENNPKESNEGNKNNESSAFNSVNNENSLNTNENNNHNNNLNNNNNQAVNDMDINSKDKNSFVKTPKNQDLATLIKNTFSDIKANKFDLMHNKPRRSSVAFLIPKGKEELKIENSQSESNNNLDPTNNNNKGTNEILFFNTIEANIAPQGKYELEEQTGQKYLVSLGRKDTNVLKSSKNMIKFDFNLDLTEKPDSLKRDDIVLNYLYPILDFFDNKKFNMQRLKPLDFSDIKKIGQEGRTPGIYKQLSKEDKKKYLENLLEVKTKQREMKNKRIEEIKKEGRRYNFVKIKNNTIGIPKLDFYVPYSEQEIIMTKKCLENRWEFPPPSYYDNYEAENKDRAETTLSLTDGNVLNTHNDLQENKPYKVEELSKSPIKQTENIVEKSPKKANNKTLSPVKEKNRNNNLMDLDINDKLNLDPENEFRENLKEDALIDAIEKGLNQEKVEKNKDAKIKNTNKKSNSWSREVYLNIINHNLEQYNNSIEPLAKYNGGNWLNYSEFKKYFNFFILLHHPKSFKFQNACDNLWNNSSDSYEYNKKTSVIFLNNLSENLSDNTQEIDLDPNNIENKDFSNTKRDKLIQQKKSTLLILFEPNNTSLKSKEIEELFYYANFDLIDSYGKEIQSNIILSKFYSTYLNENLEKDKNYFLILKSFVCPFGFNFSVYSDHACDNIDYGTYLKKFYGFVSKVFKLDHPALERNKTSLICKFKIKLLEKTYFKINLNYSDKLSKKFMEVYLFFGRSTQNKKRISFDLNEKILFEPLPGEDEYILALVVNPPYVINSNSLEVDFFFDRTSAKIELLETIEPFKLYDRIKANKYGIVFKEFIFAFENTYITFELKIQKRKNFNFSENTNADINSDVKDSNHINSSRQNLILIHKNNSLNFSDNINNNYLQKLLYCEEDLHEKLRMKIQIFKSNELLFEEEFFNKITIQNWLFNYDGLGNSLATDIPLNLNLTNQKTSNNLSSAQINNIYGKQTQPYLMVCTIDLSELKIPKESLENLEWVLRVYSSEPVIFTKDTSKEDSEKLLKDNWENKEPGRSEKARKSRLKHLIICKKNMGKILSPDEEQLLLEDRPKTVATASLLQHLENNNLKGDKKNVNKKLSNNVMNSKPGNNQQKTNTNLPKLDMNVNTQNDTEESTKTLYNLDEIKKPITANPNNHKNHNIRDFLYYTIQERTIQKDNMIEQDKKIVLNEHNLKKKNEQINKQIENYESIRKTEGDDTLNKSILSRENLKTFYKTTNTFRIKARDNCSQLYKQRDLLKNDLIKVIEIENSINDILNSLNFDFNYSIGIYKESRNIEGIKLKLRERLFQLISLKKDEFYKAEIKKLTNKDKNVVSKYVEDIQENKWFVSPEIMIKLKELMQDSTHKK